ncbi:MAG: translocation/assembly module TamB domain-containing protein, partial [Cyclobacteriaceae bacterium]|nr:translocation/assembly module TamB domain-containing protein [Cyclobacteriaceae bacterium]
MNKRSLVRLMLWGSYRRPILKVLIVFILFISTLLVGITVALQFPSVQTKISGYLANYLSEKIGIPISIGYVNIYWFGNIQLKDVMIRDTENKVLISADKIRASYNFQSIFGDNQITLENALVENARVQMIRNAPDGNFNINVFVEGIKSLAGEGKPDSLKGTLRINNIHLINSTFTLSDPGKDSLENRFNPNQFKLMNINAIGENLQSRGKNFQVQINDLSCRDSATQFMVHKLSGFYQITDKSMVFRTFDLNAGNSRLEASMVFQFDSIQQLKSFTDSVVIIADIKESNIHTRDLGNFTESFKKYDARFRLNGFFSGTVSRFEVKDFDLALGAVSRIRGSVNMDGLPDFQNTFIDLNIENSILQPMDLEPYLSDYIIRSMGKFGTSSFNGRFIGFPVDFVSDAIFYTQIGTIDSDINLKVNKEDNLPSYSGSLVVRNFDLGTFLDREDIYQSIDLNGRIEGTGLYKLDADFYLDAAIDNIGILGYNYQNIVTDGRFASQIFNGYLGIMDPNLQLELNGTIDLRKDQEKIDLVAVLDTALLHNLNLSKKPASISTLININLEGINLNNATGQIQAGKSYVSYDGKTAEIDNLKMISEHEDGFNFLELSSDNMDLHMSGKYVLTEVISDLGRVVREYLLIAKNDRDSISSYFSRSKLQKKPVYDIDYNITLVDINAFANLFIPDIFVAKNTRISGFLKGGPVTQIAIDSDIDTVIYKNYSFIGNHLDLSTTRMNDTLLVDLQLNVVSDKQLAKNGEASENVLLTANWINEHAEFAFNIEQKESNNRAHIKSYLDFDSLFTRVHFEAADLTVLGDTWNFSDNNEIQIRPKDYKFNDFLLSSGSQQIEFTGYISADSTRTFQTNISNFQIENLNPLLPRKFSGILDGFVGIERFFKNPVINSQIDIDSLVFEKFNVGDVFASSQWDTRRNRMNVDLEVFDEDEKKLIDVGGNYYPFKETDKLDLAVHFTDANLNLIQPFYDDLISDLDGKTRGDFRIGGTLRQPLLNGEGYVNEGVITLDYLKSNYDFEGRIVFTKNEIGVRNLVMRDKFNNTGTLNGGIFHDYFKNVRFNIRGEFNKLLVLNTTIRDNDLFYGTAFGTGNFRITGQEKNINIDINAVTDPGTRFYIPLSGSSEISQENFIEFLDFNEQQKLNLEAEARVLKLQGIKLDFDLEVTPDAYAEIIFDQVAGDIIRGRGNGQLSLTIDTQGEFNMFGNYLFESGGYNFTLYNVINKEFTIEPESQITWSGDPYGAQMDLVATYRQVASLAPLFDNQDSSFYQNPEVKRKYPAEVELQLKGPLMAPEINFDIDIRDYPTNVVIDGVNFETTVAAFRSEILSNEQELKRQVFSLIILRKFAEQGSFSVGTSFGNSVSEFVSNQLSYWITQLDENLEIDLDLGTLDQNAFNAFQFRLSYSFNEGRLRVTRAGNITNEDANEVSNIIGDWTIEYLLSEDGQ